MTAREHVGESPAPREGARAGWPDPCDLPHLVRNKPIFAPRRTGSSSPAILMSTVLVLGTLVYSLFVFQLWTMWSAASLLYSSAYLLAISPSSIGHGLQHLAGHITN